MRCCFLLLLAVGLTGTVWAEPSWSPASPNSLRAYAAIEETQVCCEQSDWFWQMFLDNKGGEIRWPNSKSSVKLSFGRNLGRYLFPAGVAIPTPPGAVTKVETPSAGWVKWSIQDRKLTTSCDLLFPSQRIVIKKAVQIPTWSYPP